MSRKIVWTDFLKEEAIFRFWYVLENNNFKNAIKHAQKEGRMNYAHMHNALYSGLYYPESEFVYRDKTAQKIKQEKGISKNTPIANFMDRHEILKNIHAMGDAARAIRLNKQFGYNAKLYADEFNLIGKQEAENARKARIKTLTLYTNKPAENENVPNKPNRYNLARRLMKENKDKDFKPHFKTQSQNQKFARFSAALKKYYVAKRVFEYYALSLSATSKKVNDLRKHLDEGVYRTILPHYGLDFNVLVEKPSPETLKIVTRKEVLLHAEKFEQGIKVLKQSTNDTYVQVCEKLKVAGAKTRQAYIKKERAYPECNTGFLNTFCEMISHKLETMTTHKNQKFFNTTIDVADKMIDTIEKLKQQYEQSQSPEDKQEVEDQIEQFRESLENSNEFNV